MATTQANHALDGQSFSELMMGLSIGLGAICTVVVSARIYTRTIMLNNAGLDDLMIVITQILAIGLNIATILEAHYGVGRHSWLTGPDDAIRQLQCLFAAIQLYIWSLCFVKVSLLLQYRRIFLSQWLQRTSVVLMVIAVVWNMAQSILVSFGCVPMGILHPGMADTCIDSLTIWYIAAGMNITTDFIVFLIPIPLINSLQLPLRQKILLCLVFCLGFFACTISIVRATTLYSAVSLNDPSWYGTAAAIWSMVEVNCAILCSCLPTIRYFLANIFPCLGLRTEHSRNAAGQGGSHQRRPGSGFVLRSTRKSAAAGARRGGGGGDGLDGSNLSAGSRKASAATSSSHRDGASVHVDDLLATRWGADYEKGGVGGGGSSRYHSNHISAWVSAAPQDLHLAGAGGSPSPTSCRAPRTSADTDSERALVEPSSRKSDRELGNHIIITRETLVEEGRTDDDLPIMYPPRVL